MRNLYRSEIGALWSALAIIAAGCARSTAPPPGTGSPTLGDERSDSVVTPFEGVRVTPERGTVEVDAWTCLESGWLEQIACSRGTREHEALVVVQAPASEIHAALLLAGFQPGAPGFWSYDDETVSLTPPHGDPVEILVRLEDASGAVIETPIGSWIAGGDERTPFPATPWVFAGSRFALNPEWMEPGEHYVADMSGSVVGLVTFGDEVVAFSEVLPDEEEVQPPQWRVREGAVPPRGTRVTLILRRPG
jgi:hypothetical protein